MIPVSWMAKELFDLKRVSSKKSSGINIDLSGIIPRQNLFDFHPSDGKITPMEKTPEEIVEEETKQTERLTEEMEYLRRKRMKMLENSEEITAGLMDLRKTLVQQLFTAETAKETVKDTITKTQDRQYKTEEFIANLEPFDMQRFDNYYGLIKRLNKVSEEKEMIDKNSRNCEAEVNKIKESVLAAKPLVYPNPNRPINEIMAERLLKEYDCGKCESGAGSRCSTKIEEKANYLLENPTKLSLVVDSVSDLDDLLAIQKRKFSSESTDSRTENRSYANIIRLPKRKERALTADVYEYLPMKHPETLQRYYHACSPASDYSFGPPAATKEERPENWQTFYQSNPPASGYTFGPPAGTKQEQLENSPRFYKSDSPPPGYTFEPPAGSSQERPENLQRSFQSNSPASGYTFEPPPGTKQEQPENPPRYYQSNPPASAYSFEPPVGTKVEQPAYSPSQGSTETEPEPEMGEERPKVYGRMFVYNVVTRQLKKSLFDPWPPIVDYHGPRTAIELPQQLRHSEPKTTTANVHVQRSIQDDLQNRGNPMPYVEYEPEEPRASSEETEMSRHRWQNVRRYATGTRESCTYTNNPATNDMTFSTIDFINEITRLKDYVGILEEKCNQLEDTIDPDMKNSEDSV